MGTERELLRMKEQVDRAKTQVSELTGHHQYLMTQLKEEYGCSSIQQGNKKVQRLEEELATLDEQLEEGVVRLRQEMEGEREESAS
jgi:type VI protein secretion system component VasK